MRKLMLGWVAPVGIAIVAAGCWGGDEMEATAQEVHPGKEMFVGAEGWPARAVAESGLINFEPFRAVYERVYTDQNGNERRDHIIITAERVAWNETPAISVSLIDAGSRAYDDTAMRIQTRVFSEDDNSMLLFIGPAPGSARDYAIAHTDGTARATVVEESGEATRMDADGVPLPQLGTPGAWLLGSMRLEADQRIAFANADLPAPSSTLGARPVIVLGQERFDAGPLGEVDAWSFSYPLGMTNGRVMHNFVIDRPPYLVGKRPLDLDTGETTELGTLRLVEFTTFGQAGP